MCGIVAGVAQRSSIVRALLEGLKRLEYRGYDSCGVAVLQQHGAPRRIRTLARVQALETEVRAADLSGSTGIAHTRWATHGMPAIANAHPIFSGDQIAVVHNGIIENHEALREALIAQGYEFASRFIYLEDGDIADLLRGDVRIVERDGGPVVRDVRTVAEQPANADLGAYRHYMQKEIFEQPLAVARTVPHLHSLDATLFGTTDPVAFAGIDSVLMLGCGTSYFSALTARAWFESIAGIAAHAELSSEYRYRDYVRQRGTLVVPISQSGETADTLAALRYAQSLGEERTLTICNVAASAMVRQSRWAFVTQAGPEIGVASTKAFTTQLVALFLLALTIGRQRGRLNAAQTAALLRQLVGLPDALRGALAREPQIMAWAQELHRKDHALFIGRGLHYPIALEGALKMKEISYIHAEGYPAGELKHGPLALVTDAMPVIVTAPNDILLEKLKSNMQEVRARGGQLYVIADANTHLASAPGVRLIWMPDYYGVLSPLLHVVAFQLLAYHVACLRGTDVDKPRNLAKSVTVE
ncbi:glutamine--fructose-6-phosphate transaminase (isomerizing) [Paraburkholderia sp. GAS348]|uniref:glutamine--fructose-6-phosphate transaminase (isomerizing) n=1 Tax=Paraburkholderia sp. GAS348 TaxID=3035132 RepID=UPI003D1AC60D